MATLENVRGRDLVGSFADPRPGLAVVAVLENVHLAGGRRGYRPVCADTEAKLRAGNTRENHQAVGGVTVVAVQVVRAVNRIVAAGVGENSQAPM